MTPTILARSSSSDGKAASALTPLVSRAVLPIVPPRMTNFSFALAKSIATFAAAIGPLLKGPTLIAYSGDPVAAPKEGPDGGSVGVLERDLGQTVFCDLHL